MNPGHTIFKRAQRLQRGTGEVRGKEPPFAEGGQWWWERADEQAKQDDEQGHRPEFAGSETPEQMLERRRRTAYKTVGVNINGEEVEIPIWDEDMTPEQAEGFARDRLEMGLSPFASDMELEAAQNNNAKRLGYAEGTSNVLAPGKAPWDYFNPWGGTTKGGSNTGIPTQKGIGTAVGTVTNFFVPGLGYVTGPIARWITSMIQHGLSKQDIQQAVQQAQQQQPEQPQTPTPTAPAPPTTPTAPHAGVGIDPWGNPADPGEWWSNDFGRWITDQYGTSPGDYNLQGPGGQFGTRGLNFSAQSNIGGSGTVGNFATAIGFGGPFGGGISAGDISRFRGQAGYSHPYTEAQYNAPTSTHGSGQGPGYQLGPGWTPRASYAQYLEGFHAPGTVGSSTGPGGAAVGGTGGPQGGMKQFIGHTPRRAAFAMGTSSVNPGLKMFHAQQKRKKQ